MPPPPTAVNRGDAVHAVAPSSSPSPSPGPPLSITLDDVMAARRRIAPRVHRTPLLTCAALDDLVTQRVRESLGTPASQSPRVRLAFKAEHLQKIGAFKMRGATNAVLVEAEARAQADRNDGDRPPSSSPSRPDGASCRGAPRLCFVTQSSGNHAAALALASRTAGYACAVVMPVNAARSKLRATIGYGAAVVHCDVRPEARAVKMQEVREALELHGADGVRRVEGYVEGSGGQHFFSPPHMGDAVEEARGFEVRFVHPFEDPLVMAGQGTLALEMLEQVPLLSKSPACSHAAEVAAPTPPDTPSRLGDAWKPRDGRDGAPALDLVVVPVGGGGVISGVATALHGLDDRIRVIGAEPLEADDARRSYVSGVLQPAVSPPRSVCDGLLSSLGERTLAVLRARVADVITVSEAGVVGAMRHIWERSKQLVEPSGAVGLGAALESERFARHVADVAAAAAARRGANSHSDGPPEVRVCVVWTGGNVDLAALGDLLARFPPREGDVEA